MKDWERRKYVFVLQYIFSNVLIAYIVVVASEYPDARNYIIMISTSLVVFLLLFRLIPAFLYLIIYKCKRVCGKRISKKKINENRTNGERILKVLK